ncbi:E3 ubiquitin-protein ligase RAD18-like [Chelonus insularis]|uniref:E3 ubiquitin-protein ligase RAD18-like n=1 Tax=Chelonus insularis TaxID=460826 RepID=UPI00158902F8|nr:E3 ubiquitin-protein ligase RAD18-like [Chelonus insularis]
MERYSEIQLPHEYSEFKTMENLLTCQICYDYMDTPVITLCSHNYCSLCIRKYLHYKTRCPLCFKEAYENELRPNRILEDIINNYTVIREKLKNVIKEEKDVDNNVNNTVDSNSNSTLNDVKILQSASGLSEDVNKKNDKDDNEDEKLKFSQTSKDCQFSPNKACSSQSEAKIIENCSSKINEADSKDKGNNNDNKKKIACSVCQVEILLINKDKHAEACTERESHPEILPVNKSERQPLPKLVLNLMKDSELKKKMKELGLPIQGTRKVLESRYLRYCTLYNAECDKKKPRSIAELLKQCKDDEALEKKLAKVS